MMTLSLEYSSNSIALKPAVPLIDIPYRPAHCEVLGCRCEGRGMAQTFEGAVRVTGNGRQTIVDSSAVLVGRRLSEGVGPHPIPGGVFVDPDTAQPGPFTRLVVGDAGAAGAITILDEDGHATISLSRGIATFGT